MGGGGEGVSTSKASFVELETLTALKCDGTEAGDEAAPTTGSWLVPPDVEGGQEAGPW